MTVFLPSSAKNRGTCKAMPSKVSLTHSLKEIGIDPTIRSILMTKNYLVVFILFLFIFNGHSYGAETRKNATDYYTLVKQLKNNDKSVDFKVLRYSYTKTPDYKPYDGDDADKDAMYGALNKKEFVKAAKHAQAVLEKNYVDMDAHFVSTVAYGETKNKEKQEFHSFILKGLLDSIYDSGNGQTPETAFVVINTSEEYFFLNVYGYNVITSSLVKTNGHSCDKMETEDKKTGEKAVFYFNVDMPFNWLNAQMGAQKK
jgi:hypothetical protein